MPTIFWVMDECTISNKGYLPSKDMNDGSSILKLTENTSKNSPKQKPFHINSNHSFTMRMGEGAYTLGVQLVLPENKTMKIPYMDSRLRIFRYFPCSHIMSSW